MADTIADSPDASFQERLKGYVKTQKGCLLAAETFLSLVILACYTSSSYGVYAGVPVVLMAANFIFFGLFMMGLDKCFNTVHWPSSDLLRAALGSGLYLVTSVIIVFGEDGAAGGAFGLIAAIVFAYDAATTYMLLKNNVQQQNYNYNLGV